MISTYTPNIYTGIGHIFLKSTKEKKTPSSSDITQNLFTFIMYKNKRQRWIMIQYIWKKLNVPNRK